MCKTKLYQLIMANKREGLRNWRVFEASFLFLHVCAVLDQFYEIIFVVDDNDGYAVLFRKIHCGLMATASLFSSILYHCGRDSAKSTRQKLEKIDYTFEMIAANEYRPPGTHPLVYAICVYIVLIVLYFYTRCLRGQHFYACVNFVAVLKDSAIRTYFAIVNAFIALHFTNSVFDGKSRLVRLDDHFNVRVSTGRRIIHINELNDMNSIYFQIIDYCNSVRKRYQVPIFMILTSDLLAIIYMILTAFHEFVSKSIPLWAVSWCIVDPFVRVAQTVVVVNAAEAAMFQAHRWSDTVQRIMIERRLDTNVKEGVSAQLAKLVTTLSSSSWRLRLFLMEMIDRKVVFVISGFFKLSHETLVAMMGTVSTYLLIMMQFQPLADVEEGSRTAKSEIF